MITSVEKKEFKENGQQYVLETWNEDGVINIQVFFQDGQPANPFRYKIAADVDEDFLKQHGIPGKEALKDRAIQDIKDEYVYGMKL